VKKIIFFISLIGLIILVSSLIKLRRIKYIEDDRQYMRFNKLIKRYLILCMIGLSITSIMKLLLIVLR
jgi:hypothetical protein